MQGMTLYVDILGKKGKNMKSYSQKQTGMQYEAQLDDQWVIFF